MKPCPQIFDAEELTAWSTQAEVSPGRWAPARPITMYGVFLRRRLRAAWLVFTGRCDVVRWRTDGLPRKSDRLRYALDEAERAKNGARLADYADDIRALLPPNVADEPRGKQS